ncbi:MAG: septum formation protein Maf [Verrucomicrobia bacterium]|nr:septum formation protein Maf [Verrucomicrobiota bacterium]MBV9642016.1 septum formation protein Maf [Verrucomicrobiota bacterium]
MGRLILASSSPRRFQLLREAKFQAEAVRPEVTELSCDFLTASELTRFNAKLKAGAVAAVYPDAVILGADTVVALGGEIFGKPRNFNDATRMLQQLVGKTHEVVTGIALLEGNIGRITLRAVYSTVTLRSLSSDEIEAYLRSVNPLDKAGAYAAQNSGNAIIERIKGSFTNVVGLPMELIGSLLRCAGIHPTSV